MRPILAVALAIAVSLGVGPALAADHGHGRGKSEVHGRGNERGGGNEHGRGNERGAAVHVDIHIGASQRTVMHEYYRDEIHRGHCPPGLAKKHNGCMPPGQAKKRWAVGHRLPRDVVFHDLPPRLVVKIGPPPAGYRYARVANDILLIAVGTGMVMDAITDLGRQ